tara:strand:+ start:799 stop:1092 length:294 start_codon:yes stop_codon:yes gene_type:complete
MPVIIRPVAPDDRTEWEVLYQGYADFYGVTQTPDMRARVWGWLHDPDHGTEGLVAVGDDGTLLGLAHFRAFALRPPADFLTICSSTLMRAEHVSVML